MSTSPIPACAIPEFHVVIAEHGDVISAGVAAGAVPTAELARLYFDEGLTTQQIATRNGHSQRAIWQSLTRAKYKLRAPGQQPQSVPTEELIRLSDEGLSPSEISKRVKLAVTSVRNRLSRAGYQRGHYGAEMGGRLIGEDLDACRLDAAWEARTCIVDRVICRMCGERRTQLSGKMGHLNLVHPETTVSEYRRLYPGAPLQSLVILASKKHRDVQQDALRRAALYLTSQQLKDCRNDNKWEDRHNITDYVICRRCGRKISGFLGNGYRGHLRAEKLSWAEYEIQYPGAPRSSAKHKAKNQSVWRDIQAWRRATLAEAERGLAAAKGENEQIRQLEKIAIVETVSKKLAAPAKYMWMPPTEVAEALGVAPRTFYRNVGRYRRLIRNQKGWYSTASVIDQIKSQPLRR